MSLRVVLRCDGHVRREPCQAARTVSLAYSPTLRSDDPDRFGDVPIHGHGWRIAALPTGGDLCPYEDHDEDRP